MILLNDSDGVIVVECLIYIGKFSRNISDHADDICALGLQLLQSLLQSWIQLDPLVCSDLVDVD